MGLGSRFVDLRISDDVPLRVAHHIARRIGKGNFPRLTTGEGVVPGFVRPIARFVAWNGALLRWRILLSLVHLLLRVHADAPSLLGPT